MHEFQTLAFWGVMSLRCHVVHTACRSWVVRAGGTRGGSPSVIGIFCTWWGVNSEYETSFTYLVSPSLCVEALLFRVWPIIWLWTRSAQLFAYLGVQARKRTLLCFSSALRDFSQKPTSPFCTCFFSGELVTTCDIKGRLGRKRIASR